VKVWLDAVIRIAGFAVGLALAALTAGLEAVNSEQYWTPTVRAPYSLIAALVLNPALVWFAYHVTGRRGAAFGPVVVWVVVMFAASSSTAAGDLILTSENWVGIGTLVGGVVAFAAGGYRLLVTSLRPPKPADPA
jgi:hypothetical protein